MQNYKDNQLVSDENSALSLSISCAIGDREDQQDSFGFSLKNDEGIIVVCDGMGGHEGGRTASNIAITRFIEDYDDSYPINYPDQVLLSSAKSSDLKIASLKSFNGKPLNAGSTCVAVVVKGKKLYWCSVGDSRAYLLRKDEFVQLTQDQNYKAVLDEKLHAGMISEEEYKTEVVRGDALISYLGIGNLSLIDYSQTPLALESGDKVIISSDGLYKLVPDEEIQRIVNNFKKGEEVLLALEMKAKKASKSLKKARDNMTVAIIAIK